MIRMNMSHQLFYFLVVDFFVGFGQLVDVLAHGFEAIDKEFYQVVRIETQGWVVKNLLDYFKAHDLTLGACLNYDFVYDYLDHTDRILVDQRVGTPI